MILIIGLGNPGKEYSRTRHNIGREIAEAFAGTSGFGDFRYEKKWDAEIAEGTIAKEKAVVALPDTMMNKSGLAAAGMARFFKITPARIFVIHDDADIPAGKTKLSFGRNAGGHKGVESLIKSLKTNGFWRFRVGIAGKRDIPAEKIVLKKWSPEEIRTIKKATKKTLEALECAIIESPEKAMNEYNK